MSSDEIEGLLSSQFMSRIAFNGDEYPYLAPFRYVRINGILYFHFTDYGKKMKLLEKDNRVCVQIESYLPNLSKYNFISIRGNLVKVHEPSELQKVINLFAETGRQNISTNFLAAHGFSPEEGWDIFNKKDLVLFKLVDIVEKVGLKSPD
jgi:nitroimidazol reductase NimA-like FMN-containing flavoprotein (pyridoxamine 5'-phosphate oxidase superfamily)